MSETGFAAASSSAVRVWFLGQSSPTTAGTRPRSCGRPRFETGWPTTMFCIGLFRLALGHTLLALTRTMPGRQVVRSVGPWETSPSPVLSLTYRLIGWISFHKLLGIGLARTDRVEFRFSLFIGHNISPQLGNYDRPGHLDDPSPQSLAMRL